MNHLTLTYQMPIPQDLSDGEKDFLISELKATLAASLQKRIEEDYAGTMEEV